MTLALRPQLWLPPIAVMGLIFFLSAQPDLSSGLGSWDLVLRKLAHATVFGVLCLLWCRALRTTAPDARAFTAAWLLTLAYAVSDEWHQTFVTGRHGAPVDVLIDAAGATIAVVYAMRRM
jgi:VanZ family protein